MTNTELTGLEVPILGIDGRYALVLADVAQNKSGETASAVGVNETDRE